MQKWMAWVFLVLILVVAAVFRWTGLDWDGYYHFHPDERYIHWIATTIEWPDEWQTAFSPSQSTFNPYYWPPNAESEGIVVEQDQPRKFAYGHLPLYLGVAATKLMGWMGETVTLTGSGQAVSSIFPDDWFLTNDILNRAGMVEFRHLAAVTRAFTGLIDLGTIVLVFLLGRRLFSVEVGLLAAVFLALNVMHIQLAHFFIVDPYLTFFTVTALYFMIKAESKRQKAEGRRQKGVFAAPQFYFLAGAVFVGLAVGTKFSAVLLFLPLAVTAWLGFGERWISWWITAVFVAFLTFFITNPFAVLDWSCEVITPAMAVGPVTIPRMNWASCYLDNISTQSVMVNGGGDIPFTRQYEGTLPYMYFFEMQFKWGMGPLLAVLGFGGFGWAIWRFVEGLKTDGLKIRKSNTWKLAFILHPLSFILLSWMIPFFLITGGFYVKFMRYLQPMVPFLMLYAAAMVLSWQRVWWRRVVWATTVIGTGLYALAFVSMYATDHPWMTASQWIYENVPAGSTILSEQWDDSLPISKGETWLRDDYLNHELTWLTGAGVHDSEEKLAANLELLAEADYLTLVTNRVYGVVSRLPVDYPFSSQYHQLLFDGALGYELVTVNGRYPHLSQLYYRPDTFGWPDLTPPQRLSAYLETEMPGISGGRVDESFVVYDQPLTLIFRNVENKTTEEMRAYFVID
jgi:hypothetical protein